MAGHYLSILGGGLNFLAPEHALAAGRQLPRGHGRGAGTIAFFVLSTTAADFVDAWLDPRVWEGEVT